MRNFLVLALVVMVAVAVVTPAAGAGEFFKSAEEAKIRAVVAEALPGCNASIADTDAGTGILVGPQQKNILYFFIKRDGDMRVQELNAGHRIALEKIARVICEIMETWPAQRWLASGPKELRGK
jgi:hypothetical protein